MENRFCPVATIVQRPIAVVRCDAPYTVFCMCASVWKSVIKWKSRLDDFFEKVAEMTVNMQHGAGMLWQSHREYLLSLAGSCRSAQDILPLCTRNLQGFLRRKEKPARECMSKTRSILFMKSEGDFVKR